MDTAESPMKKPPQQLLPESPHQQQLSGAAAASAGAMELETFDSYRLFGDHQQQHQLFDDYSGMLQQHQHQHQHQQHHLVSLYDLPRPEKVPVSTISYLPQHPQSSPYRPDQPAGGYHSLVLHQSDPATGAPVVSMVTSAAPPPCRFPAAYGSSSGGDNNDSCSPNSSTASNQSPAAAGAGGGAARAAGNRGAGGRGARKKAVPSEMKDSRYFDRRQRNNAAAKKSRDARKHREDQVAVRADHLEKENALLRSQLAGLQEEVNSMKEMLRAQQQQQLQQQRNHRDLSVS